MQVVQLYIGPMRSGKTTAMYSDVERHHFAKKKTVIIKYAPDNYRGDGISAHSGATMNKVPVISCGKRLFDIVNHPDFIIADVIGIDEVQFYEDGPEFVARYSCAYTTTIIPTLSSTPTTTPTTTPTITPTITPTTHNTGSISRAGKSIYMSGLDSDFRGRLFGRIAELLPLCDRVNKLSAVCECGNDAMYTHRIGSSEELELIGDLYVSACRQCFKKDNANSE
jgi:thymidine kinase